MGSRRMFISIAHTPLPDENEKERKEPRTKEEDGMFATALQHGRGSLKFGKDDVIYLIDVYGCLVLGRDMFGVYC